MASADATGTPRRRSRGDQSSAVIVRSPTSSQTLRSTGPSCSCRRYSSRWMPDPSAPSTGSASASTKPRSRACGSRTSWSARQTIVVVVVKGQRHLFIFPSGEWYTTRPTSAPSESRVLDACGRPVGMRGIVVLADAHRCGPDAPCDSSGADWDDGAAAPHAERRAERCATDPRHRAAVHGRLLGVARSRKRSQPNFDRRFTQDRPRAPASRRTLIERGRGARLQPRSFRVGAPNSHRLLGAPPDRDRRVRTRPGRPPGPAGYRRGALRHDADDPVPRSAEIPQ